MIRRLRFSDEARRVGTTRVRAAEFAPISTLRLSAICDVANNARERLSTLFDCGLSVELFEPSVVPMESRAALFADATVFCAHGAQCDLLVVFRARDARRIAAAAFREDEPDVTVPLSPTEERVLEAIARELAGLCHAVSGPVLSFNRANARVDQYDCASYFELRFSSPLDAIVGIGISKDPQSAPVGSLARESLYPVSLPVRARIAKGTISAGAVANLMVGSLVAFESPLESKADLLVAQAIVARGDFGEHDGRCALRVAAEKGSVPA